MSHWQIFVIVSTLVYATFAFGAYAYLIWKATPMLPYAGAIPAFRGLKEPEKFLRLVALVVSFGWPVALAVYGYAMLIEKMGKLAGIKWEDFVDLESIKSAADAGPAKAMNFVVDQGVAALANNIEAIGFEIAFKGQDDKEGKTCTFWFTDPERVALIMSEKESLGEVLQSFIRDSIFGVVDEKQGMRTGEIDAEFEPPADTAVISNMPLVAPPLTRRPLGEEVNKLDRGDLIVLMDGITFDRARACQLLLDFIEEMDRGNWKAVFPQAPNLQLVYERSVKFTDAWAKLAEGSQ